MGNNWYHNLMGEKREAEKKRRRDQYNSASPQEKLARSKKRKERDRKRMAKWGLEDWKKYRAGNRKRWKKYVENLSPEEKELLHEKIKLWKREDWASLSPEKRQAQLDRLHGIYLENRSDPIKVESERLRSKLDKQTIKLIVFTHYCNGEPHCMNPNCEVPGGVKNINGLCLEHTNGDGYKHREAGLNGTQLYRYVIKQGYPESFRIWCATCNQIKKIEEEEDRKARLEKKARSVSNQSEPSA